MNIKKAMMAGAATALFVGSVLNVSAAKTASDNYANALKESNRESLIIDVEAYKAAYSDLAASFGDDTDAYIEHYLTIGVYEGRTKGVLFDPLAYAEAYDDVKSVYGFNIPAIIDHYLTFGVAENRTAGTANGYADIAEAEKNGASKISVRRDLAKISNAASNTDAYNRAADPVNTASDTATAESSIYNTTAASSVGNVVSSNPKTNTAANTNVTANAGTGAASTSNNTVSPNNNTGNTSGGSNTVTAPAAPDNNTSNTASDNYTAQATDNSTASNEINGYVPPQNNNNYHHTTSIYDNDESTLIRVEYYDENNKLFEFSQVTDHDSDSNSYTEDVYYTDQETGEIVHDRTDIYVNGALSSSEKH